MKIHKRIDVTDKVGINIPKKRSFPQSITCLRCCFWSCGRLLVIFFLRILTDSLKGLKCLCEMLHRPLPPRLHLGPCLQALIFHWEASSTLLSNFNLFGGGGGGKKSSEKGVNATWHKIPLQAQNKFSLKDLHMEGIYFHKAAGNHLSSRNYCISIGFCKTTHLPLL